MATGMKQPGLNRHGYDSESALRKDRVTAIVVCVIMLAMISLLIWLASFGGGNGYEGIETWPMMP